MTFYYERKGMIMGGIPEITKMNPKEIRAEKNEFLKIFQKQKIEESKE